jgi:hypothetical protein
MKKLSVSYALSALLAGALAPGGCGDDEAAKRSRDAGVVRIPPSAKDDTHTGTATVRLALELPPVVPVGVPFPIVARVVAGPAASGRGQLEVSPLPPGDIDLRHGRGSASVTLVEPGPAVVTVTLGEATVRASIVAAPRPERRLAGVLQGADLRWDADADVVLTGDVEIPEGATLTVASGARVLAAPRASVDVKGRLVVAGTKEAPVLFTRLRADGGTAGGWGGIHVHAGGAARLTHALLTQGGADPDRAFGHRVPGSPGQPLVFADGGEATMEGGAVVDTFGRGPSAKDGGLLTLRDLLVSRVAQGGETASAELLIEGCHYAEIPDADGRVDGDDSDGLHLFGNRTLDGVPRRSVVRDTVFAVIEDDAIDHQSARLDVERVWIENVHHEAIAASGGDTVTITDGVITRAGQGIEAGFGAPQVVVKHTLLAGCGVGLRWGDEYLDGDEGTLTVETTAVVQDLALAGVAPIVFSPPYENAAIGKSVHEYSLALDGPGPRPFTKISCSMVDSDDWNGKNGNQPGRAAFDGRGCIGVTIPGCDGPVGPRCE